MTEPKKFDYELFKSLPDVKGFINWVDERITKRPKEVEVCVECNHKMCEKKLDLRSWGGKRPSYEVLRCGYGFGSGGPSGRSCCRCNDWRGTKWKIFMKKCGKCGHDFCGGKTKYQAKETEETHQCAFLSILNIFCGENVCCKCGGKDIIKFTEKIVLKEEKDEYERTPPSRKGIRCVDQVKEGRITDDSFRGDSSIYTVGV